MPSPTTARGLIGIFPRGADSHATDQHSTTRLVQSSTYSFLRAILAARSGGRGTRGVASSRKGPRDGAG